MTSNANFNQDTTGTEAAKALSASIKDKNVVITGVGPASIGSATALAIASQGPQNIILASRTASKLDAVAADLAQKHPSVAVHTVLLDLASLDSIQAAVDQIEALVDRVDVLINNAGISHMQRDEVKTAGDTIVDLTFFTNHLGPFWLTHLLSPKLRAAASSKHSNRGATRIINVSSHAHRISPVRFHDYQINHYVYDGVPESQKPPKGIPEVFLRTNSDGYPGLIGYGQSKTANILHATELTRRFKKAGADIIALSLHPGSIQTELTRDLDEEGLKNINVTIAPGGAWKTLDQGAATSIVAAFDPQLGYLDIGGEVVGYLTDCQLADDVVADYAKDAYNAEMLFHESERMLGKKTGL